MKKFWFYYFAIVASTMLLWLFAQTVNAGVIPGTLNKGTYTSSTTCGTSTNSYNPSGGYCSNTYCRTYAVGSSSACGACTSYQQISYCSAYAAATPNYTFVPTGGSTCTAYNGSGACVASVPNGYSYISSWTPGACIATSTYNGACLSYPTCRDASFGCADYYHYPIPSGTLTFTNYLYANGNPSYALAGDNRKLGNDTPQTCNQWANGTNHSPPWMWGTNSCQDGSSSYYVGGANGVCNTFWSTDNLITSFNQVGAVTRSAPADTDATCTVQGRYASADDTGPSISLNGVSSVFDGDQNNWCNYTKYRAADYGTPANPELPGCKYYKNKISHGSAGVNPDLLEGLTITVDDPSGISQVTIELGSCTAVYDYASDVSSILVSTTTPSGVKSAFKGITYNYNIASTSSDSSIFAPSLLQKFGVTRLDACLMEGKNYLKILAKDQARSDADGVSYSPNFTTKDLSTTTQFIKIDNAGPAIGLTGNAAKIAEANTTADRFVGGATIDGTWKNFTINGGLKSTDPFGSGLNPPSCLVYTGATYTCTTSASKGPKPASAGVVWSAPSGVNATTGVFTGYMCDGLGPIPSTSSCDWSCATGYTFDTTSNACVASSNLFILFAAGTPNATGNVAAKLTSDASDSRGLLKTKDAGACIAPFDPSVRRTYSFKYQSLATYNFSTVPTGPFQIVENGTSSCVMPPPPPPVYTYDWYGNPWGACSGACGTNGTRYRKVVCKRSDGASAADTRCTGTKPATSEPCAMAVCPTVADSCPAGDFSGNTFDGQCTNICTAGGIVPCVVGSGSTVQYRSRWCPVTDSTGNTTLGYGWATNTGAIHPTAICYDPSGTGYPVGTVVPTGTPGEFVRCDSKPDTEVDINMPLQDKYCPVGAPSAPSCTNGTVEISPTPSLNCADTSTPSSWYKSAGTGRCGEQEGIDYWNNTIATIGITAAKSSFDNSIVNDCVRLSGTSDLTACFSKILCGYGDYISNTNQCVRNDCGLWKIDGMCGSANGGTFSRDNLPPDTQQCSSGIAIHSQVANGKFDWKCDGRDGGVRVSCSATITAPSCTNGTVEISPTPSLNCADTSTASSWYKSAGTGRCGEQEGIDYWNNIIADIGITAAKSSFDYSIVNDCVNLSGTSDLTTCFSKILCGYGDYISNTNQCVRNDCGLWKIDGMCGSANGGTFSRDNLPPDTQQCSSGIAIHSQLANGKFDWKCDGRDGGARVSCSATVTASSLRWMQSTPSGCLPNTTAFVGDSFTGYEDYKNQTCYTLWDRVTAGAKDLYGSCPVGKQWMMTLECGTTTAATYDWNTGGYGTCSATCGGGTQTRTVVCQDNSGNVVDDSYCTEAKPAVSQNCGTQLCAWACKDSQVIEQSNDICTNYGYGNAMMYLVFPNGLSSPSEWWQSNVVSQWSTIYTGCTGWNLHYKSFSDISSLPDCGPVAQMGTWTRSTVGNYDINGSKLFASCSNSSVQVGVSYAESNAQPTPCYSDSGNALYWKSDTATSAAVCGSANGVTTPSAPTTGFCSVGSRQQDVVLNRGSVWTWACSNFGGAPVECSAPIGSAPTALGCTVGGGSFINGTSWANFVWNTGSSSYGSIYSPSTYPSSQDTSTAHCGTTAWGQSIPEGWYVDIQDTTGSLIGTVRISCSGSTSTTQGVATVSNAVCIPPPTFRKWGSNPSGSCGFYHGDNYPDVGQTCSQIYPWHTCSGGDGFNWQCE